jgi:VanZ family protein
MLTAPRTQWLLRFVFGGYAGVLFALTHWPRLRIDSSIERPDLYAHITAFGLWTALLVAAGAFGPRLSRRNIVRSGLVAIVYAPLDEFSQAIPGLGRSVGLDDLAANIAGILLALSICFLLRRVRGVTE